MFAYFFSLILLNVFISLVASNARISTDSTKAVKFRSHADYEFKCLQKYWSGYFDLVGGLSECDKNDTRQRFFIKNLKHINDKLKPNEYPITDLIWFDDRNNTHTELKNVRFEKFDDITWLIVNANAGQQCLTFYWDYVGYLKTYLQRISWMNCAKDKKNFPSNRAQRWDIENW
jgi:hypothetical protein